MAYLVPYSGFRGLDRLRQEMDDLWARFLDTSTTPALRNEGQFLPKIDVRETEEAILIDAEVPGLKPEEINVELHGEVLTISGEKKSETKEEKGSWHIVERSFGSFSRSLRVPVDVDRDKLEAKHTNGVLHISLPKARGGEKTRIEIKPQA